VEFYFVQCSDVEVTAAVSERVSLLCIYNLRRENPSFTRSHFHPLLPSPPLRAAAAADAGCNPHPNSSGNEAFEKDSIAAYYQMVKWVATADTRYSTSAMAIIDAWAATLQGFAGHDQMLAAGICKSFLICTAHSARRARSVSFSHASLTTHKLNVRMSRMSPDAAHKPHMRRAFMLTWMRACARMRVIFRWIAFGSSGGITRVRRAAMAGSSKGRDYVSRGHLSCLLAVLWAHIDRRTNASRTDLR
jgi:hypothetical protein